MKIKHYIIIGIILLGAGFGLGRWAMPIPEPVITYVPLPTVSGSEDPTDLEPVSSSPADSIIYITVYKDRLIEIQPDASDAIVEAPVIDTMESYRQTVVDWNVARVYKRTLFDTPELGRFDYSATVQFNTLSDLSYTYAPVQRQEVRVTPKRVIEPFVRASYNTFDQLTIGGGLYYKDIGLDAFYIRDPGQAKQGFGIGVGFKF